MHLLRHNDIRKNKIVTVIGENQRCDANLLEKTTTKKKYDNPSMLTNVYKLATN